jgi:hypothetical protein
VRFLSKRYPQRTMMEMMAMMFIVMMMWTTILVVLKWKNSPKNVDTGGFALVHNKQRRNYAGHSERILTFRGDRELDFFSWLSQTEDKHVAQLWRRVVSEIENKHGYESYLLKVADRSPGQGWYLTCIAGQEEKGNVEGGNNANKCQLCNLQCLLSTNLVIAGDSTLCAEDTLFQEEDHMRCWLDAKARPLFKVSPKRHCSRMSELSDVELVALWRAAESVLKLEHQTTFQSLIINHGNYQTHQHLHLKIQILPHIFTQMESTWFPDMKSKIQALRAVANSLPEEKRGVGFRAKV